MTKKSIARACSVALGATLLYDKLARPNIRDVVVFTYWMLSWLTSQPDRPFVPGIPSNVCRWAFDKEPIKFYILDNATMTGYCWLARSKSSLLSLPLNIPLLQRPPTDPEAEFLGDRRQNLVVRNLHLRVIVYLVSREGVAIRFRSWNNHIYALTKESSSHASC